MLVATDCDRIQNEFRRACCLHLGYIAESINQYLGRFSCSDLVSSYWRSLVWDAKLDTVQISLGFMIHMRCILTC